MTKLYELTERYKVIEEMTIDEFVTSEEIIQTLAVIQDSIENKVENIAKMVLQLNSDTRAIETELERLKNRKASMDNTAEWLKSYLLAEMTKVNLIKVKRETLTVSVANNPPSVEVLNQEEIAVRFIKIIPERHDVDKTAILQYFRETQTIPTGVNIVLDRKHITIR